MSRRACDCKLKEVEMRRTLHFRNCNDRPPHAGDGGPTKYNNNHYWESLAYMNAILLFQQRCMWIFSLSLLPPPPLPLLIYFRRRWLVHVAHVRCERARARHVARCAHCATNTTIHTCPSVRSFVRSSGSTTEHKCPQEERYHGVWLGPPGRQNRPFGRAVSNPLWLS